MAVLKENRKGFTLIELLVVAALLFVVLSIAAPRFSMLFSIREKQEIKYLHRDLLYARNTAITEKKTVYIDINIGSNSYKIYENDDKIIKEVKLKDGVILTGCLAENFWFTRSGTPSVAQTITFKTRGGDYFKLTIPVAAINIKLEKVN